MPDPYSGHGVNTSIKHRVLCRDRKDPFNVATLLGEQTASREFKKLYKKLGIRKGMHSEKSLPGSFWHLFADLHHALPETMDGKPPPTLRILA